MLLRSDFSKISLFFIIIYATKKIYTEIRRFVIFKTKKFIIVENIYEYLAFVIVSTFG